MGALAPVLYLPHGGGPMPLLEDPAHAELISFLKDLSSSFSRPNAIVVISAHWEEEQASVYADAQTKLLFDYHGFPPKAYEFTYPVQGSPKLAENISALLQQAGVESRQVTQRGFDHGMFVPMMLLYPEFDIPCVQLSLISGLDSGAHLKLGTALKALREQNVVIVGSGMSFHNLRVLTTAARSDYSDASDQFADWLGQTMSDPMLSNLDRLDALRNWQDAPYATFCHPRAEHFIPLLVCAAAADGCPARTLFDKPLMGHRVQGFGWSNE